MPARRPSCPPARNRVDSRPCLAIQSVQRLDQHRGIGLAESVDLDIKQESALVEVAVEQVAGGPDVGTAGCVVVVKHLCTR